MGWDEGDRRKEGTAEEDWARRMMSESDGTAALMAEVRRDSMLDGVFIWRVLVVLKYQVRAFGKAMTSLRGG